MQGTSDKQATPRLVREMLDPGFYSDAPSRVELRETHCSWVFIAGRRAYKVKKPLRLPFLDYGTLKRRLAMCRAEIELNRRLAPDYYLRVRSIIDREGRLQLADEDDPTACEYVVEMVAIPEQLTLENVALRGELERSHLLAVASRLADFHRAAPIPTEPERSVERLLAALAENNATLAELGPPAIAEPRLRAAEGFTEVATAALEDRLRERVARGLVRDCHGDLRAEHVLLTDPVQIYDCIEFDPALREIDVAADLAFLLMDLARLGSEAEAFALIAAYRDAGGDPGGPDLLAFLAAYRAWVRAKVARLAPDAEGSAGLERARRLHELGHRFAWQARRPFVLAVAGTAASGKSTLVDEICRVSGIGALRADAVRKELGGVAVSERGGPELYTDQFSELTYRELGARAARELRSHGAVIIDATARHRRDRDAFRSGLGNDGAPSVFAICEAPAETLLARAAARDADPSRISDADLGVVRAQLGSFEALSAAEADRSGAVRTDLTLDEQLGALEALVDRATLGSGA